MHSAGDAREPLAFTMKRLLEELTVLGIGVETVRVPTEMIRRKIGAPPTTAAVSRACELGILPV